MNYIRLFIFVFISAAIVTASSDSDTPADTADSTMQPNKIAMSILGKDIYETLSTTAGTKSFDDTLISLIVPDSAIEIAIDYSGFKRIQIVKVRFYENTAIVDTSKAPEVLSITKVYKPESKALLMRVSLARTGWITMLKCDTSYSGSPIPLVINTRKSIRRLGEKEIRLSLNRYDINAVEVKDPGPYRPGALLIEFPDPYGPPVIVDSIDMKPSVLFDNKKKEAIITANFLPRTVTVGVITNVQYATIDIKNVKTEDILEVRQTKGTDSIQLDCRNTYECIFRKPGYNTLRKVITVNDNDTTFTFTWKPFEKKKILLRSLALPGWGQYYSQRDRWWLWPAFTATTACFTTFAAISMSNAKDDYEEYNQKYLSESNQYAREKYDTKRRDAVSTWRSSRSIFYVSIGTLGLLWGGNIGDALVFAIGPNTKVSVNPLPAKRNVVIDF